MMNRIATNATTARVNTDLARSFRRMTDVQTQIATGKRLQKPSDDPAGVASALGERATQRRLEQYATNATDAIGWLRVTDGALMGLQEQATQAKVQVLAAISGALDSTAREALATDVDQLRASMVQIANQTYQGRSVFGGTMAMGEFPYDVAGGVYSGVDARVERTIDEGMSVKVNVNGTDAFGPDAGGPSLSGNVFQVLDKMAAAIRTNDLSAMNQAHSALEQAMDRMSKAQIKVGETSVQIESTVDRNKSVQMDVKERLSQIEDVDLAEAIISARANEAAYQAALGVTAKIIQPSLLDYLR